jgi:hypothetical protein
MDNRNYISNKELGEGTKQEDSEEIINKVQRLLNHDRQFLVEHLTMASSLTSIPVPIALVPGESALRGDPEPKAEPRLE